MPNPICGPRGALAVEVDATEWAGETLFTVSGTSIDAAASWTTFDDVLAMLTGRGCGLDGGGTPIVDLARDAATATGTTVTAAINANDRIVLRFTGATAVTLAAGADNAVFGFDPAGQSAVLVGGNRVLTAVSDWQRGNIENAQLDLTRSTSNGLAPALAYRAHTAVQTVRQWGTTAAPADADDNYPETNLQQSDKAASWGIDADGHVWRARDVSRGAAPVWVSTTFRDALGFTGEEIETSNGDLRVLTATYPCRWLLTPSRPWENVIRGNERAGSSVRASDRGAYAVRWSQWDRFVVTGYIDGPADRIDRQSHWLQQVWPYFYPGVRCNLYQDWGDGRRGRRTDTTSPTQATGSRVTPYSVLYTSQRDGEYGRWLCRRDVDGPNAADVEWSGRLQRRSEFTATLTNYEGSQ